MAAPTKSESTSVLSRFGTSSKRAFPASCASSFHVAFRTPHFVRPTPTTATFPMEPSQSNAGSLFNASALPFGAGSKD